MYKLFLHSEQLYMSLFSVYFLNNSKSLIIIDESFKVIYKAVKIIWCRLSKIRKQEFKFSSNE